MVEQEYFTEEEIQRIRQEMTKAIAKAREVAQRRGHTIDPRIKDARKSGDYDH